MSKYRNTLKNSKTLDLDSEDNQSFENVQNLQDSKEIEKLKFDIRSKLFDDMVLFNLSI